MDWIIPAIAVAVIVAFFAFKRASFVSPQVARVHLAAGALVIDVRTPQEFADCHLPSAINIPLGELSTTLPRQVPDKNKPLLLHCLSGGRSAIATNQLRSMGYSKVFNLGSYRRAQNIVAKNSGRP